MSSLSLTLDLLGALVIGYFIGFAYTKIRLLERFEAKTKNLKELVSHKDGELMALHKDIRKEYREKAHLSAKLSKMEKILDKKIKQYNILKESIKTLKSTIKEKTSQIQELEDLVLDIQNDFTLLNEELNKQKELNNLQKEEYKQKIEELTQKANDLYMVKGTEELKNAKDIFNKLREKSLNDI